MARAINVRGELAKVRCDGADCSVCVRPLGDPLPSSWLRLYEFLPNGDAQIWEFCPDCAVKTGIRKPC